MSRWLALVVPASLALAVAAQADPPKPEQFDSTGFVPIFNGMDLTGWHVSAKSGHSRVSKNTSGGKWVVEDGAIVGTQDVPGNGGFVITDKKYKDFEVVLEMRNDDGPDSGLFLRSTEDGKCYQAMIDYHKGGNLMGLYGEGLGGKPHVRHFDFGKDVTEIKEVTRAKAAPLACPVKPEDWKAFWNPAEWNELRARIEGNPPKVTTWIKGVKFLDGYQDDTMRLPDDGGIALQVHGGGDHTKEFVRYRNVRVKELNK